MKKYFLLPFFVFLLFYTLSVTGQGCTGSIGDPILNETFGAGTNPGPPLAAGITNMTYWSNTYCPNDGYYSVTNFTSGCFSNHWITTTDHTGDPNGYFMLVNASYAPSDFYVRTVSGLCDGTVYKFSAWIINMNGGHNVILPNITFTIEQQNGTVLSTYQTGNIPIGNPEVWTEYFFYFKTPVGISDVVLRMRNNAPGGNGNDLGLDDITFRPVGPATKLGVKGFSSDTISICKKGLTTLNLFSSVESCYDSTVYQWQQSIDSGTTWNDILGATDSNYNFNVTNAGKYQYRLLLSQFGNITNPSCRVHSPSISINVTEADSIINKLICQGDSYLGYNKTGTYVDSFFTTTGCDSLLTINLTVIAPPPIPLDTIVGITTICKNTTTQLTDMTPSGFWISENTTVANIDYKSGLLTGLNAGEVSIHYLDSNICGIDSAMKTITVIGSPLISKDSFITPPTCIYPLTGTITVNATGSESPYSFSLNGGNKYPILDTVKNLGAGAYEASIYNNVGCIIDSIPILLSPVKNETCDTLYVPTAFIPSKSVLKPYGGASFIRNMSFKVYNRYGSLVFESTSIYNGWNGQIDGIEQKSDTYVWCLDYTFTNNQQKHTKGTSILLR